MAPACQGWNGQFVCVLCFCFELSRSDLSDLTISASFAYFTVTCVNSPVILCYLGSNGQGKSTSNDPQTSAATTCWQLKIWSNKGGG